MRVLALDTTTREGSVALVEDERVIAEEPGDPMRSHGERLPGDFVDLLARHSLRVSDMDGFAIAAGPGSFTGLRIGIACVQGLAMVLGKRVVAVSVLDALAQSAAATAAPGTTIAAWMDAHRGEVFSACCRVTAAPAYEPERLIQTEPPLVAAPRELLGRWAADGLPSVFVGDGAVEYAYLVPESSAVLEHPVLAGTIGRMAVPVFHRGDALHPAAIQPIYVRRPDAEIERDRRRAAPAAR
jgi:tRNA threonylcarbamoyladenosine biosynthesis protein TsaB